MAYTPKPHISAAVQHSRFAVSATAGVLGLCLFLQVVVWSVVHFTDSRTTTLQSTDSTQTLEIIHAEPEVAHAATDGTQPSQDAASEDQAESHPIDPVDVNTVTSATDITLRRFSALVQTVGVAAGLALILVLIQATVIAGGGGIPGIEKAVSASSWAIAITLLCLPMSKITAVPYNGIFEPYDSIVAASNAYRTGADAAPGALGFYGWYAVLPFVFLGGLVIVVTRFRAGVEAGIIVTSVSQLDEKLEQEIRSMKLGQLAMPRSVGALHSAIGDSTGASTLKMTGSHQPAEPATGTDDANPKRRPI